MTAALLLVPPLVAPFLCGPIPAGWPAGCFQAPPACSTLSTPILLGNSYLDTPVLPRVAVEYLAKAPATGPGTGTGTGTTGTSTGPGTATATGPAAEVTVVRGSLVSVDDRFTTVLDEQGQVHFLPGADIAAQVLCVSGPEPPGSVISIHGWQVEQSVLSWAAPRPREAAQDALALCRGD